MLTESYKDRLKSLAGLNEVKHTHKNEYGALMLYLDFDGWDKMLSLIDKEDIYDEEPGFGLEKDPHVTVLFGFHKDSNFDKIKELVKYQEYDSIEILIKNISHFETPDYDVVKLDIESKQMNALNKIMTDNFEYTNDYPDYHPHMTIAYVKKGTGKKYDKKNSEIKTTGNRFVFSPADSDKKMRFTL